MLWLGKNDETRIFQESWKLRQLLKDHCQVIEHGWDFPNEFGKNKKKLEMDTIKIVDFYKPDLILIYSRKKEQWLNLDKVKIPKAMIMTDPHGFQKERTEHINESGIAMTLFRTIGHDNLDYWRKHLASNHQIVWLPQSCDTERFINKGYERIYDFVLLGRSHRSTYPFRYQIYTWLGYGSKTVIPNPDYKVFHRIRPKRSYGWGPEKEAIRKELALGGEYYADALNRALIMPTGSSVYGYAVAKVFEPTGTETALAINKFNTSEELGFKEDYNYISLNFDNFKEKLSYYIETKTETIKIAKRARELMVSKHSTQIRAEQLYNNLRRLINDG